MKKFAFVVFCFLFTLTQVAYATDGGEGENTTCNGVGNPNSYCDGTEGTPPVCNHEHPPVVHNHVCVVPTDAASAFFSTNFVFNPDPKACAKQCKTVAKACGNVAKAQGKCYAGVIKGAARFSLANCKTVADKTLRAQCVWNVQHNSGENLDVFKANTVTAVAFCKDTVQQCVAACND